MLISRRRTLIFAAALALSAMCAYAQTTNATIVGDVRDPAESAVVGASVVVKSAEIGVTRTVTSDASGSYRVYPLNPGTYEVSVTAPGFKTQVHPNVVLDAAANVKVDFKLEVGSVTESVQVEASSPVLQTQDASVGGTVTGAEVSRLPVNGRNYTRLIILLPGTSDQGQSQALGTFSGTQLVAVNGQRRQDNNYTLDGADNNFMMEKSPGSSPPMDSIAEFRVLNNGSAEFGTASGANVNTVTKSGTRDLHMSFYEYFRNDKLNANGFFANLLGQPKVAYKQNQYGVSAGGPVTLPHIYSTRDKTFWFANWEGYRRVFGNTILSNVPTGAERNGDFSALLPKQLYNPFSGTLNPNGSINRTPFPGNMIPASMLNKASLYFLSSQEPLPTLAGVGNNLLNTKEGYDSRDAYVIRVDHSINEKNTVYVRWSSQAVLDNTPNANPNLQPFQHFDAYNMAASYVHLFSATSVFEAKFGFNNPRFPNGIVNPANPNRAAFLQGAGIQMLSANLIGQSIPGLNATGENSMTGGGTIGANEDRDYQYQAHMTQVFGGHTFKYGFDYTHRNFFANGAGPGQGTFDFDSSKTNLSGVANSGDSNASLLLGVMSDVRRGVGLFQGTGIQNVPAAFFQDDWRVNSKLTVNLGVRYEYSQPMYAVKNNIGSIWVQPNYSGGPWNAVNIWAGNNPLTGAGPNQQGFGRGLQRSEYDDFAPRVGIAYQVTPRTVVRAGVGIFFNSSFAQEFQDRLKLSPYIIQELFTTNTGTVPDLLLTSQGPPPGNNIGGWPQDPNKRTPYSEQWNFTVQQQLMNDLSLEVGYVGNANHHQIGYTQINQAFYPAPTPVATRRPLPQFGDMDGGFNIFNSNYEALHFSVVKRFSKGMQLQANYTYGKSLADQSSLAEEDTQNEYNRRPDWGRSSIDLRQVFKAAWVYELPFGKGKQFGSSWNPVANAILGGWVMDGIIQIQTPAPMNIVLGSDYTNSGKSGGSLPSAERPNLSCNPNGLSNRNTSTPFYGTSCFSLPSPYTYGNAGFDVTDADGRQDIDFTLMKDFHIREKDTLEFRTEVFNLLNHVNMGQNLTDLTAVGTGFNNTFGSPTFGRPTATTPSRQIQLVLRYFF